MKTRDIACVFLHRVEKIRSKVLTCEYENSRQVIENIISPTVIMKYCGTIANICIEFSVIGKEQNNYSG